MTGAGSADPALRLDGLLYVGTVGGMEASIVSRAGVDFRAVPAAGLRGLSLGRTLANVAALAIGTVQAWRILREFRPDVLLATGGYGSAPAVAAAWVSRCPVLIYLPDIEPGLAVRFLSRLARRVAVSFEAALAFFAPGKAVVTGYPVRQELYARSRTAARQNLGLSTDAQVLLVLGGSLGAHAINVAVSQALGDLLARAHVIHVTGHGDIKALQQQHDALPAHLRDRYHPHAYLHEEMVDALLSADLAVARAGAATMGEFAAVGLPGVLVPYPFSGQHQEANADYMISRGAARKVREEELAAGALGRVVGELLADSKTLRCMGRAARRLAEPDAAGEIARQLALLAGGR
jgi:UDP-N-acetylglucosamine--N-acetylmuramyl-(pentapeptide) pyrophosphoryl-undecaprenol N-acetylglucosamine transferase